MTFQLQEAGAVAGLVALVALFALSVLYVPHARDVRRLREWAASAPEAAIARRRSIDVSAAGHAPRTADRRRRRRAGLGAIAALTVAAAVAVLPAGRVVRHGTARLTAARIDDLADVPRPARRHVTVAVLNGSGTAGAASRIATSLTALGFRKGTVTNANALVRTTRVSYQDSDAIPYARVIARLLHVTSAAVRVDPGTQAAAGRQADVVITVGPGPA